MPKSPLTDTAIKGFRPDAKPIKRSDGGGLYLQINPNGSKLWRFAYRFERKQKLLSFGKYPTIGLARARELRDQAKKQLANGLDPSAERKASRNTPSLNDDGESWNALCKEWLLKRKREKASTSTLKKLTWLLEKTYPDLGNKVTREITAPDLLSVLRGVERLGRYETAKRLRSTCGQVMRYAIATGRAERDISADLKGALTNHKPRHHPAILDPKDIGALLRAVKGFEGDPTTRTGLLIAAYTFLRSGEIRTLEWSDVNWERNLLTIPAERMKGGKAHVVPLSGQVLKLLGEIRPITGKFELILPSLRSTGRPVSENTFNAALRRLGYSKEEMVTHGFRTIASTILNENGFRWDWIERQLAHSEKNKVRAAYNAAEYLKDRSEMMQWYANHLDALAK